MTYHYQPLLAGFYGGISLTLSSQKIIHKRSIYTLLDLLGDVGGLLDALRAIGGLILSAYTFAVSNPINSYLMNVLFYRRKSKKPNHYESQTGFMKMRSRPMVEVLFCTCLRGKKEKRILAKGMARTENLLEIDNFLRT